MFMTFQEKVDLLKSISLDLNIQNPASWILSVERFNTFEEFYEHEYQLSEKSERRDKLLRTIWAIHKGIFNTPLYKALSET